MADLISGSTVGVSVGVEVRASGGTTVGVVTELVDVHSTLSVGIDMLDLVLDDGRSRLVLLGELDNTGNTGVTTEDSDYSGSFVSDLHKVVHGIASNRNSSTYQDDKRRPQGVCDAAGSAKPCLRLVIGSTGEAAVSPGQQDSRKV